MKTAKELNEMTIKVINRRVADIKEKALVFLNEKIYPRMEKAAANGEMWIEYHVDAGINATYIIEELELFDYQVTKKGNVLCIRWAKVD